ncbi:hypothetical protein AMATHDRAFT_43201 [Amanita thiersii Skay4041]|uniref:Uncharacterized protein n=1 Tax=Amanita thiersii Skay4041 TaxID=703135 RepID=A0A2A9NH87_9AGAR|nr:hypothetical protein AMATHDRAFT_43201 [Amanita thiersii Skay4041]
MLALIPETLQGSKFGMEEDIDTMVNIFDKNTKPSFKSAGKSYWIKFGRVGDNDLKYGIRSGTIKLNGTDIATLFEPAVKSIIKVVEGKVKKSTIPIKVLFLVGGFATSDYLFETLQNHFTRSRISLLRPDAYLNKAVAEGAVSYYLDHTVKHRVSKYDFGIPISETFNVNNADHIARQDCAFYVAPGDRWVGGAFSVILPKNTTVSETKEYRRPYFLELSDNNVKSPWNESCSIQCYRGLEDHAPEWIDKAPNLFTPLCTVTADVSNLIRSLKPNVSKQGKTYYVLSFSVVLLFGLTELDAEIAWTENGVEKRGPATIVYDFKKDDK